MYFKWAARGVPLKNRVRVIENANCFADVSFFPASRCPAGNGRSREIRNARARVARERKWPAVRENVYRSNANRTLPRGRKSSEASVVRGDRYHRAALKRIVQLVLTDNFRAKEGHQLAIIAVIATRSIPVIESLTGPVVLTVLIIRAAN